ncbi:MAG TPA: thioredoxin family protein [Fimbriiglobus sp.]|nr:thioredoxin family protein [Fimbriiglobus sp.]
MTTHPYHLLTREQVDSLPGPVVVEFGASGCEFCQELRPRLAAALERYSDVRHIKVEDGPGQPLGRSFRVKLWPTLVFLRDGKMLHIASRPSDEEVQKGLAAITGSTPG